MLDLQKRLSCSTGASTIAPIAARLKQTAAPTRRMESALSSATDFAAAASSATTLVGTCQGRSWRVKCCLRIEAGRIAW